MITSKQFYSAWHRVVLNRKEEMLKVWKDKTPYTNYIRNNSDSVIRAVATELGLLCYPNDYYSIDSLLYKLEDLTPGRKDNSFWFRSIRVAFEHENEFNKKLYEEISHLLITNCELRVLVTYPNKDDYSLDLKRLHEIVRGSRISKTISDEESLLLIFGFENGFAWEGYVYKEEGWKLISS